MVELIEVTKKYGEAGQATGLSVLKGISLKIDAGRSLGDRRSLRLWQEHAAQHHRRAGPSDERADVVRRSRPRAGG